MMHLKFYNRFGLFIVAIAAFVAALIGGGGEQPNTTTLAITAGSMLLLFDLGCRWWQYRPEDDKILFLFAEPTGGQVALMPVWIWGAILTVATLAQISILIPCGLAVGIADMVYRLRQAHLNQASAWLALAPSGGTPRRYFTSKLSGKLSGQGAVTSNVQRSYQSPAGLVVLRLLMLAMWVLILLYGFDQPRMMHFALALPETLRWLGVGGAVVSLLLLVWVHRSLGQNWSRLLQVREVQMLVMHGPYQWVRHLMYAVLSGFYLCAALVAANSLIALVSMGIVMQFWTRIESEEHMMIEHFGDAYRDYMQQTGRLLPRLRG